ncbi:MAG: Helix-turn-helix domain [Pseudonocardiales bacterium]|jgi:excisionase family DNA binding protein|nr:Helix-turn-helix domain [Pseudonocardiales bacterium]
MTTTELIPAKAVSVTPGAPGRSGDLRFMLTIPEAAAKLRVSRWTFYKLINNREVDTIKIGTRRLVSSDALQRLVVRLEAQQDD